MKKFFKAAVATSLAVAPFAAFAVGDLAVQFNKLGSLIGIITPVIVALALLGFFWGLAMYVLNFSGDDKDKKKGRDMMVYGTLVLFVMVSVWGIVQILQETFGLGTSENTHQNVPSVVTPNTAI